MPKKPKILLEGNAYSVELAVRKNGKCDTEQFLNKLDIKERAKITSLIKRYADYGRISNTEKFKKIEGPFWEFKNFQTRIIMYNFGEGVIVLTHGLTKKTDKLARKEIDKAKLIKDEYDEVRRAFENG